MTRRAFCCAVGLSQLGFAEDWLKGKQVSDWTPEERGKAVTKSPWAKETEVSTMIAHESKVKRAKQKTSTSGMSTSSKKGTPTPAYIPTQETPAYSTGLLTVTSIVRWESAQPMIEVAKMPRSKAASDFYVLSVSSLPLEALERLVAKQADGALAPSEKMIALFKEGTKLERKGKEPIFPGRVDLVEAASGSFVFFLFSKQHLIGLEDKEVTFSCKNRLLEMKAKFVLRDMVYGGKLEL